MKKKLSLLLSIFVIFMTITPLGTQAAGEPISVKLQNYIGNMTALPFTTSGSYQVDGTNIFMEPGDNYSIKVEVGNLSLYKNTSLVKKFGKTVSVIPTVKNSMDSIITIKGKYTKSYLGEVEFQVENNKYIRPVNHITLEDYLKGVVPAEMPASWGSYGGMEALKAQAVAARTYVLRKGSWTIYDGQSDQVYKGYDWHPNTTLAVNETQGEVQKNGSSYANTLYSSSNGGKILSNTNVWGTGLVSYFQTKTDPYDSKITPYKSWDFTLYKQQVDLSDADLKKPEDWWTKLTEKDVTITTNIKAWLKSKKHINEKSEIKILDIQGIELDTASGNISSTDVLNGKVSFTYVEKLNDSYVKDSEGNVKIQQKSISDTAYNIRFMLGTSIMRSPYISNISHDKSSDLYTIKGAGYGHGIGLSQYGAYQMSKEGNGFEKILNFYYPNTTTNRELNLNNYSHSLEGSDRYATSASVSGFGWENKAKAVVIGRGDLSIDALTGSVLAKKFDSPLLLTQSDNLPDSVMAEINRLQPEKVYLLGGMGAIGAQVEKQIKGLSFIGENDVIRISGSERYQTAVNVAKEINNKEEVFVVTKDEKSPDALSIASYASMKQIPILYTSSDSLHESVSDYIKSNNIDKVTIIGGKSAVSLNVEEQLKKLAGVVTRVSGSDRYATSMQIADKYSSMYSDTTIFFARGDVFIDALPASSLAAAMKSPVVLTQKDALPASIGSWLDQRTILPDVYFLGGQNAISNSVRDDIRELLAK
ncbi:SpoIID/LytB domain-containing protein [Bacillus sp. SCS-153A]|uniref:SpoIID/LytB domain-containing protein n=1 Tax=Rossellomorea sedimentorum TaxID=3115294 RepID=UPI0039059E41